MIVGHSHHRLEKRITAALLTGIPNDHEIPFLYEMSERLLRRGRDAWLSDRQAQWLFAILARCEETTPTAPPSRARPPAARDKSEALEPPFVHNRINLSDCLETPEVPAS
jgi:hypothetical protein